jgi:hypothetical protein
MTVGIGRMWTFVIGGGFTLRIRELSDDRLTGCADSSQRSGYLLTKTYVDFGVLAHSLTLGPPCDRIALEALQAL